MHNAQRLTKEMPIESRPTAPKPTAQHRGEELDEKPHEHQNLPALIALLEATRWLGALAFVLALAACLMIALSGSAVALPCCFAFLAAVYALWLVWRLEFDRKVFALLVSGKLSLEEFDSFALQMFKKQPQQKSMAERIRGTRRLFRRLWCALAASTCALTLQWLCGF